MKWNKFEIGLLLANIAITLYFLFGGADYSWLPILGTVSSISNVVCVIMCAKKSVANYYWGTLGVIAYAIVAFAYANTGEWMLNAFYFLPLQFVGLAAWNKSIGQKTLETTGEVSAKRLNTKQAAIVYSLTAVVTLVYAWIISLEPVQLFLYGYATPRDFMSFVVAASSTMLSVVAMVLMVKRYQEQWVLWIVVDVLSVVVWIITFNPMMIVQWGAFLINAIYGYIKWIPKRQKLVA